MMMNQQQFEPLKDQHEFHPIDVNERDACALICAVRKNGQATHGNVKRTIEGLARMGHRTGYIDGEGDGVGVLTDIPRQLWTKKLAGAGLRGSLATSPGFWVAHVFIPSRDRQRASTLIDHICQRVSEAGLQLLLDQPGHINSQVLGPNAEKNEPVFWQIAGMQGEIPESKLDRTLFDLQDELEHDLNVHFPSMSRHSVVYKVQGTVEILRRYYPELRDPEYVSTVTMGHARYSTNTNPVFERAQPFGLLGHNGEFNTISRFRMEAAMLGIPLDPNNSDSQDVDRMLQALCLRYGLDLIQAMEFIFPPHSHDLMQTTPEIHRVYREMRQAFGPFAQGPAAVTARMGDLCVFSVDSLGLRPLWFGETEKDYFASSERGVYHLDSMSASPRPMAPGEKIALRIKPGHSIDVLDYPMIQRHVYSHYMDAVPDEFNFPSRIWTAGLGSGHAPVTGGINESNGHGGKRPQRIMESDVVLAAGVNARADTDREAQLDLQVAAVLVSKAEPEPTTIEALPAIEVDLPWELAEVEVNTTTMAALGWERFHVELIESAALNGKEQIGSLGWDGPLGALSNKRVNLANFFQETVAVVTNPSIDRVREKAQFSSRTLLGVRPAIGLPANPDDQLVELETPLLAGTMPVLGNSDAMRGIANKVGSATLEDLIAEFGRHVAILETCAKVDEPIDAAIWRLQTEAVDAVIDGVSLLVLDDTAVYTGEYHWLDPLLVTAAVDSALRTADVEPNLRRRVGIVLRSGALRDLHDMALSISLGANAILPYAFYATAAGIAPRPPQDLPFQNEIIERITNAIEIMTAGLEKVTSTIGCSELRGYGHSFSSVGLSHGVAKIFGTPNYFGSDFRGLTWADMKSWAEDRALELRGEKRGMLANPDRLFPKVWKKIEDVAHGELSLEDFTEHLFGLEDKHPVAIRHILSLKESDRPAFPEDVDLTTGEHALPVVIGAMSFGSQGELSYKTYAEAAARLNIICVNGEGGELSDIMGKYPKHRGQQIASGRFGVNIELLNSCELLEIKIGQGAKPGEGGHLPGFKVTNQVASARKTVPGVALISPSNNHDLYSIEDLAQLIDELKTANTKARISVKIPVVPGVGIIAVGVAKAGADIINITGYDGGTGAARAHSLRYAGLPAEIGVWLAHRALIESGLRSQVELWCDGGMKSGRDVVKMLCLGANRVGFGTLAMVAVGCTICRGCHEGTCHVGITTHIKTKEEATKRGLKAFRPFTEQGSPEGIINVFNMLADDIRKWTAKLGFNRVQDLVGRADLLEQVGRHEQIDLTPLLKRVPPVPRKQPQPGGRRLNRPRNTLSKQITELVADYVARGDKELTYDDEQVMAMDRDLGTHLVGAIQRGEIPNHERLEAVHLSFSNSAIPGNGLAAFNDYPIHVLVEGGAQDGVGKGARGGVIAILKGLNHNGEWLDGSVGKSFAYGAQGGLFIVQGDADTRACIRLSGADVVFGGEITVPLQDHLGGLAARANLKGYAFEYMTSGRVLVLGDPGPWMCAGMTGGAIYQRVQPEMGLTLDALRRRLAEGSVVEIQPLDDQDMQSVQSLLNEYIQMLENNNQSDATAHLYDLVRRPQDHFVRIAAPPRIN